jgi:hypothetical protein
VNFFGFAGEFDFSRPFQRPDAAEFGFNLMPGW